MSLEILLLAAEYVDRRETEHGYACREPPKRPLPAQSRTTRPYRRGGRRQVFKLTTSFNGRSTSCRTTHNELEKNRRAELRGCIEKLKSVVPLDSGSHRHTTDRLLINARKLIKSLESGLRASMEERDRQVGLQRRLRRQLTVVSLQSPPSTTTTTSRRTGSRCSTSSTESTESSGIADSVSCPSSGDESEMIDVECASDSASDVDSGCDDGHLS